MSGSLKPLYPTTTPPVTAPTMFRLPPPTRAAMSAFPFHCRAVCDITPPPHTYNNMYQHVCLRGDSEGDGLRGWGVV